MPDPPGTGSGTGSAPNFETQTGTETETAASAVTGKGTKASSVASSGTEEITMEAEIAVRFVSGTDLYTDVDTETVMPSGRHCSTLCDFGRNCDKFRYSLYIYLCPFLWLFWLWLGLGSDTD